MTLATLLVGMLLLVGAVAALTSFWWAAGHGQMDSLEEGARVVFDADEPEGMPTDSFPGERPGGGDRGGDAGNAPE